MTRVVCVGLAVLDLVFEVDAFPRIAGKHFARRLHQIGGGPAANGAVTVVRLGGEAAFVGAVGDDPTGQGILAGLRSEGVDVANVAVVSDATSPTSAVLVDPSGERLIVNHLDASLHARANPSTDPPGDADAVLADLRWPEAAERACRSARTRGRPAVLDYDLTTDLDDAPLLAAATHIAFSQPALARRAGTDDPAEGLRRIAGQTDAWVAVTLGGGGVHWLDGDTVTRLPAFDVEVVETLGAGDVFHGALALSLGAGEREADAVRFASAAAALKCARAGGRAGIPRSDDVRTFLNERGA